MLAALGARRSAIKDEHPEEAPAPDAVTPAPPAKKGPPAKAARPATPPPPAKAARATAPPPPAQAAPPTADDTDDEYTLMAAGMVATGAATTACAAPPTTQPKPASAASAVGAQPDAAPPAEVTQSTAAPTADVSQPDVTPPVEATPTTTAPPAEVAQPKTDACQTPPPPPPPVEPARASALSGKRVRFDDNAECAAKKIKGDPEPACYFGPCVVPPNPLEDTSDDEPPEDDGDKAVAAKAATALQEAGMPARSERDDKRLWQMRYLRATRSRAGMPPSLVKDLEAGEDLFEVYRKNDGDWAKVCMQRELEQETMTREQDGDEEYTKAELLLKFNQNMEIVDAMIKHALETKQWREHPSAPGVEAARLYNIALGKKKLNSSTSTDRKRLQMDTELDGAGLGAALASMSKGLPAAQPTKPKPNMNHKKEVSEAHKMIAVLKRVDAKMSTCIRDALTQLQALEGITYAYGEEQLKKHRATMQTEQAGLQTMIARGDKVEIGDMLNMQTKMDELLKLYNTDVQRVKRVMAADKEPKSGQPKAKAKKAENKVAK